MEKNKKILIIALGCLSFFLVLGLSLKPKQNAGKPEATIELRTALDSIGANQLGFIFFEDSNLNSEFDYTEKAVINVSVAIRRPGETTPFITVPAETNGLVKVNQLAAGQYEVQFLNSELAQPYQAGDFEFKRYYQIIEAGKVRFSFLPTEWQAITLTEAGYRAKVGIREYVPETVLVIRDKLKLKFYDPVRLRVLGESQSGIGFKLRQTDMYYFKDNDLYKFGIKTRLSQRLFDRLFQVKTEPYWLNQDASGLLYGDKDNRWQYENTIFNCQKSLTNSQGLQLADLWQNQLAFYSESGTYLGVCREKGQVEYKRFDLENLSSLNFLDSETWFYSNGSGSYFYNFVSGQTTKYTALGANAKVVVSEDKKYLGALIDGSILVVDYPAVKLSGVEKHYNLPFSGQIAFFGDDVLISQAKACQPDGDCGEIVRVSLQGNGVWEIKDRIELKDIQVEELLGEVR